MYSNAPIRKHHSIFYGQYEDLNNINEPSNDEIKRMQLTKLLEFEKLALKENNKAQQVNNFLFQNGKFSQSTNEYDQIITDSINNLFNQINNLISSGVMSKKVRSNLNENKQLELNIVDKLNQLGTILNNLRNYTGQTISSTYIDQLDMLISQLPNGDLDQVLKTLYHLKGDILEEIGTNWFNDRIPSDLQVKAFSTGAVRGKRGQIIQDILVMDISQPELNNSLKISFKIGANGTTKELGLLDFLNFIENHQGQEQIVITDEAEQILSENSLLGIQAKSGANQLPWNVDSKNTWATIADGGVEPYLNFLDHLENLQRSWDTEHKNIKKQSPVYNSMADIQIANQLSMILHLSQLGNSFLLTPQGFVPYSERIKELFDRKGGSQYYFTFKGNINMEPNILTTRRPVIINEK